MLKNQSGAKVMRSVVKWGFELVFGKIKVSGNSLQNFTLLSQIV